MQKDQISHKNAVKLLCYPKSCLDKDLSFIIHHECKKKIQNTAVELRFVGLQFAGQTRFLRRFCKVLSVEFRDRPDLLDKVDGLGLV